MPYTRKDATSPLTERQRMIFLYLYEQTRDTGVQPSLRDMAAHFGFQSFHGAKSHLTFLAQKGWIAVPPRQSRAIRFLRRPDGQPFQGFTEKD